MDPIKKTSIGQHMVMPLFYFNIFHTLISRSCLFISPSVGEEDVNYVSEASTHLALELARRGKLTLEHA